MVSGKAIQSVIDKRLLSEGVWFAIFPLLGHARCLFYFTGPRSNVRHACVGVVRDEEQLVS